MRIGPVMVNRLASVFFTTMRLLLLIGVVVVMSLGFFGDTALVGVVGVVDDACAQSRRDGVKTHTDNRMYSTDRNDRLPVIIVLCFQNRFLEYESKNSRIFDVMF